MERGEANVTKPNPRGKMLLWELGVGLGCNVGSYLLGLGLHIWC